MKLITTTLFSLILNSAFADGENIKMSKISRISERKHSSTVIITRFIGDSTHTKAGSTNQEKKEGLTFKHQGSYLAKRCVRYGEKVMDEAGKYELTAYIENEKKLIKCALERL